MKVNVLFFSRLRDVTGVDETAWELGEGRTIRDLLASLYERYPGLRAWDGCILTAMGLEYAPRDQVLQEGDRVAVMPPVQGG